SGEGSKRLRNVLMTYTPGNQIFLSDTIPNIDGELLKAISMANEK
ncbi:transcriptional regulator, partial [Vibrio campbellii]